MAALGLRLPGLGRPRWAPLWGSRGLPPVLPAGPGRVPAPPGCVPVPPGAAPVPPGRGMAGHNRWSKVRHVKGPRDEERSRLFQRMAQLLRAAAREGGAEPSLNPALAAVLEQCRTHNVPKATIETALRERPAGGSRVLLGVRGPEGSLLLLDVLTDNVRRCQAELRTLLDTHRAALAEGVQHRFRPLGVVRVSGRGVAMEAALEAAAAAGAQDVVDEDQDGAELKFLCDPRALGSVRRRLAAAGLRPLSAAREFVPLTPLTLAGGPAADVQRLLRALAERPDVLRTFHNLRAGRGSEVSGGHPPPDTAPPRE